MTVIARVSVFTLFLQVSDPIGRPKELQAPSIYVVRIQEKKRGVRETKPFTVGRKHA